MRNFLARFTVASLIALQFSSPFSVLSQEEIRQRRTQSDQSDHSNAKPQPATSQDPWKTPPRQPVASVDSSTGPVSKQEPIIRVALATDVRSANISTSGQLMNATDVATTLVALNVARVRVEPRLLAPVVVSDESMYRVQIAGLASRGEAEQKSKEIREIANEDSQLAYDTETKTWSLLVGSMRRTRDDADSVRSRLEEAGFAVAVVPLTSDSRPVTQPIPVAGDRSPASPALPVRPVSRPSLPSREVVVSAAGAGRLFSSSAPVTFASDDEKVAVRYNDRPYRGRIEVFTNTRGALTVVNVLGLEDYVKGVVPNELSPGGFPLLEAHKAQAIAARTYALKNRGQFMSQGYDLLPTTRSQVYRGLASENSLSSRAVDETRGMIATFDGEPINALYTSTCGGRTEDSQNIFNDAVSYLRARECSAEGAAALGPFTVKTLREPAELKDEQNVPLARDVALLTTQNFGSLRPKLNDAWLNDDAEADEVRIWLASVARLARQVAPTVTEDVHHPAAFATALTMAAFGESRGSTLLNNADVEYFLAVRDANDIPPANRPDVAFLIRDGYLAILPDATLRPREPLSRGRALHTIARILEARNLLQLQKGTARPTAEGALVLRSSRGKDQPIKVSANAFLFRQIGEKIYPVRAVASGWRGAGALSAERERRGRLS